MSDGPGGREDDPLDVRGYHARKAEKEKYIALQESMGVDPRKAARDFDQSGKTPEPPARKIDPNSPEANQGTSEPIPELG